MESDERAFLKAIADAPDDEAPRLIFADWLEERDDPRAAWVRDREIFAWMGPDATDPTAIMTRTWEEKLASLEYIAREQVEATEQQVRDLGRLIGRLGEAVAEYAWEQFTDQPTRWPYLEPMLVEVAPWFAPRAAEVARLAHGVVSIHRWLAFQILIAGGRQSPAMMQQMFNLTNHPSRLLQQSAYNTLVASEPPYRQAVIEFAVGLLQQAIAEDRLQDTGWLQRLIALIGADVGHSTMVLTTLTSLLTCRNPAVVEAAGEALEKVRDQVAPLLGQAIRDCPPHAVGQNRLAPNHAVR